MPAVRNWAVVTVSSARWQELNVELRAVLMFMQQENMAHVNHGSAIWPTKP
jgi:hypothetical protein